MISINISREFSKTPGGRFKANGQSSGEEFRENFLDKHFSDPTKDYKIQIILDGGYGYPTSFLEEAFGGLARKCGKEIVKKRIEYISEEEPLLIEEIFSYIEASDK